MDDQQRAREFAPARTQATLQDMRQRGWISDVIESLILQAVAEDTAALRAAPECPEGFVLVPVACTRAMREAWDAAPDSEDDDVAFNSAYAAMLAARPQGVE